MSNRNSKFTVREIHLAKLRQLREDIIRDMDDHTKHQRATREAEQRNYNWELAKLGIKPLRK